MSPSGDVQISIRVDASGFKRDLRRAGYIADPAIEPFYRLGYGIGSLAGRLIYGPRRMS